MTIMLIDTINPEVLKLIADAGQLTSEYLVNLSAILSPLFALLWDSFIENYSGGTVILVATFFAIFGLTQLLFGESTQPLDQSGVMIQLTADECIRIVKGTDVYSTWLDQTGLKITKKDLYESLEKLGYTKFKSKGLVYFSLS
jgi:hypothetical protein